MSTRSTESGSDSGYSSRSHDSDDDNVESDDNDSGYSRSHDSDHIGRLSDNDSTPVHGPSGRLSDEPSPKRRCRKITTTVDRISELPDSVLAHLLSFVPVEDAIKTQVLSIMEAKGLRSPLLKCKCLRLDTPIFQSVLPGIANLWESSPNLETFRVTTMSSSIYYEEEALSREWKWLCVELFLHHVCDVKLAFFFRQYTKHR
ncbi:putative F-box/LRR-repeat protein At3g18150 isoform X1 [Rhododendron vialii]|uniref:putative F-box/LRR-repeat protein At3g18150 isoform X1 n=1 Tax=Rhododendron vialii TaxID=182163 RepID=UPI00265DE321|nr:putative F-box/LRR-repeat protein At3g18150 isoform X1 [Rhododendron vialii]